MTSGTRSVHSGGLSQASRRSFRRLAAWAHLAALCAGPAGLAQGVGAISKSEAYEPPPPAPARPAQRKVHPGEPTPQPNQRPAWLDAAHKALDAAVAQAYGWSDYKPDMPDEEILKRLLALNLARAS